jgi:hypothetical protein
VKGKRITGPKAREPFTPHDETSAAMTAKEAVARKSEKYCIE